MVTNEPEEHPKGLPSGAAGEGPTAAVFLKML